MPRTPLTNKKQHENNTQKIRPKIHIIYQQQNFNKLPTPIHDSETTLDHHTRRTLALLR